MSNEMGVAPSGEPAGQCQSSRPDGMRPDFHCPVQQCGFTGQCAQRPVRGATAQAAPAPQAEPSR